MKNIVVLDALGGADQVKRHFVKVLTARRQKLGLSTDDIDRICRFGKHYTPPKRLPRAPHLKAKRRPKRTLPSWKKIEENPELMRGDIFSVATAALNIPLDKAIGRKQLRKLEKEWPKKKEVPFEVLFGGGFGDLPPIARENKLSVYLAMRVLSELT